MPSLAHAIDLLADRADRLALQLEENRRYERIARHSRDLAARVATELASLRAALEILRTAQAAADLADYGACHGDCLLCDAPEC